MKINSFKDNFYEIIGQVFDGKAFVLTDKEAFPVAVILPYELWQDLISAHKELSE